MEMRPCGGRGTVPVLRTWRVLRILMKSVPARFAPSLVESVRPVTPLPMAPQTIQWCVRYPLLIRILSSSLSHPQTLTFVPDPVISLVIKPVGNETPNFSRALNFVPEGRPDVPGPQGGTCFASVTHDDIYEAASDNHNGNG
jgi:hypothetical protein